MNTGDNDACYKDTSLFDAFIGYYSSLQNKAPKKLCMISGKDERITESHPKGTVASAYGAKAHIGKRQLKFHLQRAFHRLTAGGYHRIRDLSESAQRSRLGCGESGNYNRRQNFRLLESKGRYILVQGLRNIDAQLQRRRREKDFPATPTDYKADLKKALSGWQDKLPAEDDIVIASFDAATTGRLSITYYNELKGSDFLNRLAFWKEHCYWSSGKFGYQSPSIWEIVKCAFGTEQNGKLQRRRPSDARAGAKAAPQCYRPSAYTAGHRPRADAQSIDAARLRHKKIKPHKNSL